VLTILPNIAGVADWWLAWVHQRLPGKWDWDWWCMVAARGCSNMSDNHQRSAPRAQLKYMNGDLTQSSAFYAARPAVRK